LKRHSITFMKNSDLKRPDFLSGLCILTFIGSSVTFIGYFLASLFFEEVSNLIVRYSSWHSTESISQVYFTVLMALYALSLVGAIRMWKLHKDGFFLYIFAQLIIVLLPAIWIGSHAFSVTNAIFTTVFIVGYSLNYKWLK